MFLEKTNCLHFYIKKLFSDILINSEKLATLQIMFDLYYYFKLVSVLLFLTHCI